MTGKCTRECDEYGHSDSCWMPVCTSPERRTSKSTATTLPQPQQPQPQQPQPQHQPKLSTFMSGGGGGGGGVAGDAAGVQETLPVSVAASSAGVMMSGSDPGSNPVAAAANGHMLGDRNRNTLGRKMAHSASSASSASSPYEPFGSPSYGVGHGEEVLHHPTEEIPLAPTGEYKPTSCGTLTRREVYL
ncbi:unnamed protein product [Lota lota]